MVSPNGRDVVPTLAGEARWIGNSNECDYRLGLAAVPVQGRLLIGPQVSNLPHTDSDDVGEAFAEFVEEGVADQEDGEGQDVQFDQRD
jgi:hypothetical protein